MHGATPRDAGDPAILPQGMRNRPLTFIEIGPKLAPMRSTDSVRIWLILIQERFGNFAVRSSRVNGKPARCAWLVNAAAMTVPERSLKTS